MADSAVIASLSIQGDHAEVGVKQVVSGVASYQLYQVDLHDPSILASVAAKVRHITSDDSLIKSNIAAIQPGTSIDLTAPVIKPPTPPDPALAPFLADYADLTRVARATSAGLTTPIDAPTIIARAQKTLNDHPAFVSSL